MLKRVINLFFHYSTKCLYTNIRILLDTMEAIRSPIHITNYRTSCYIRILYFILILIALPLCSATLPLLFVTFITYSYNFHVSSRHQCSICRFLYFFAMGRYVILTNGQVVEIKLNAIF